ncbi:hypothetical protein BKA62DRAFT_772685 [Auriculariales sp. MPI-PUGE-AT-0066]|nr:hypothetical protein BKA62DRAFT_772685 [Auriculariales sp. MPI-PUGE-AT-0066]
MPAIRTCSDGARPPSTPVRASLKHNITVSDLDSPSKKYTVLYAVFDLEEDKEISAVTSGFDNPDERIPSHELPNASVAVAVIIAFSFAFAPLIFQLYIIDVDSK